MDNDLIKAALESMMEATKDDATPIIRRLARVQARHALESLATVAAANDEGVAEAFARGVQAAASFADQWSEPGAKVLSSMSGLTDAEHEIARRTAEGIAASARRLLSQGGGK